jgi:predicted alpha-1,2-mannosidase
MTDVKNTSAIKLKILIALTIFISACSLATETKYTDYVDPFIGTGGHGHTYPGASLPFGMVQLSPDTRLKGWDGCSGYHHSDTVVYGFSHTHLSGTGCSDYGDILFMPTTGKVQLQKGDEKNTEAGYCSKFKHENEEASPGYYSVLLEDYNIKVELTVTKRVGFHRCTFPKNDNANIIIDLTHRDQVLESKIRIVGNTEVEGMRRSKAWAKDQHIYFVAKFSKPFNSYGIAIDDEIEEGIQEASGKNVKAFVQYETKENEKILVKVGISAVSIEGARKNLEVEITNWGFDRIRNEATAEWNQVLSKIQIEGGTKEQKIIFYTALYHTLLNPNLFMDVDRKYRGTDLKVHQAADFENYTVFSLWDTYRATHPLFTIIEPGRTVDFIKTFIAQYENGGRLPMWELAGNYTGCMIGYHSIPVIVDAYIKGIRDFDVEKAYEAMKHSAEQDHLGLKYYTALGYIPASEEAESVSKTLEYAYDDWCIAQMAKELGKEDDYKRYIQRAQYYKNIFDPSTGFMRAKMNGIWFSLFDPTEVNFNYTEANAWQYSFYIPQDVEELIKLMGGKEKFVEKLDELFTTSSEMTGRHQADISGMIGQYAHGNEPSHHMAYLYNYANEPWKTQQRVREIMDLLYTSEPDGLCGNEDCGQMSAWYILNALGFYPVCPGQEIYVIGIPLFDKATINVGKGRQFVIKAKNISDKNIYIQKVALNGKLYQKSYLKHHDIMRGGELVFEMGSEPNKVWGSGKNDIPHSVISEYEILPVPFVSTGTRIFVESTEVELASFIDDVKIYYTLDGSTPTVSSNLYTSPIKLTESTTLKAFAFKDGMPKSFIITAEFNKIPPGRSIKLNTSYSFQYSAGGDMALIDCIRGSEDFRTGTWQGYQGVDLDAVIDLGQLKKISHISTGFLQDQGSWIFMPSEVEYAISVDGHNFHVVTTIKNDIPQEQEGAIIKNFSVENINQQARFVRVRAKNIGVCPEWHRGAGSKAWIFVDEIVIE